MRIPIGPVICLEITLFPGNPGTPASSNPTRDVTINELELGALLMQILIFAPRTAPLEHIHKYVDNMSAHVWENRSSVRIA